MKLELQLTESQLALLRRQLEQHRQARTVGNLVELAIEEDRIAPDPRWRVPRPDPPSVRPHADRLRLDSVLEAGTAGAAVLQAGEVLSLEQIADGQCVDVNLFALEDPWQHFSAARTRSLYGLHPSSGAVLWSAPPERPLVTIVSDSTGGHDLAFPACSAFEYEQLTGLAGHANCHDLLAAAIAATGISPARVHDPLNLWLPSGIDACGMLWSWPVAARRGDFVELRAETAVLAVICPCPDDLFGSSQFDPSGVCVRVQSANGPDAANALRRWSVTPPMPPASAPRRSVVEIDVPDRLMAHLEEVRDLGWLGFDDATVARGLVLRWSTNHAHG
jgi:uncharacterized protein YcgI (DUF1989 family)